MLPYYAFSAMIEKQLRVVLEREIWHLKLFEISKIVYVSVELEAVMSKVGLIQSRKK